MAIMLIICSWQVRTRVYDWCFAAAELHVRP